MSRPEKPFVLLADDNEATCTLVTAILHREFVVEIAGDGGEALEKLKTGNYGAVLLDLRMPNVDGFGVLEFLKANRPEMMRNVIVLTAALSRGEIERVKSYDICGIIAKPLGGDAAGRGEAVRRSGRPAAGWRLLQRGDAAAGGSAPPEVDVVTTA